MCLPSGDHLGSSAAPRTDASSLACCFPSTLAIHNFFFADHTARAPSDEISMSSQSSSGHPISPKSRGAAALSFLSTSSANTCCLAPFVKLSGLALSCASFNSRAQSVEHRLAVGREPQAGNGLAVIPAVMRHLASAADEVRAIRHPNVADTFRIEHPCHTVAMRSCDQFGRKRRTHYLLKGERRLRPAGCSAGHQQSKSDCGGEVQ